MNKLNKNRKFRGNEKKSKQKILITVKLSWWLEGYSEFLRGYFRGVGYQSFDLTWPRGNSRWKIGISENLSNKVTDPTGLTLHFFSTWRGCKKKLLGQTHVGYCQEWEEVRSKKCDQVTDAWFSYGGVVESQRREQVTEAWLSRRYNFNNFLFWMFFVLLDLLQAMFLKTENFLKNPYRHSYVL